MFFSKVCGTAFVDNDADIHVTRFELWMDVDPMAPCKEIANHLTNTASVKKNKKNKGQERNECQGKFSHCINPLTTSRTPITLREAQ